MKQFFSFSVGLLFIACSSFAQTPDSVIDIPDNGRTYTQVFDSLSSGLIYSRIPYGVLYDRVFPWSGAAAWQSGDTATMYQLFQTWFDMEKSRVDTSIPGTYSTMRRAVANEKLAGHIPVLFISYDFAQIDSAGLSDGRLSTPDSILTDNNTGAPPYTTHRINIAGLPMEEAGAGDSMLLEYDPEVYALNNTNMVIHTITLEDVTEGWELSFDANETQLVAFTQTGTHELHFSVKFGNDSIFRTKQFIYVKSSAATNANYCDPLHHVVYSDIPFKGDGEQYATTSNADWHVYYHLDVNGHCEYKLKKPIIILDGYDPLDSRPFSEMYNTYFQVQSTSEYLGNTLRDSGYDVIILNFPLLGQQVTTAIPVTAAITRELSPGNFDTTIILGRDGGTDFIERNAFVLVKLIQQINDSLTANGSSQKLVIVGPSMGGQISRYALAYMEKQNALSVPKMNHNTRLWVSFDSPHWGANIPVALQNSLDYFGNVGQDQDAKDAYYQRLYTPAGRELLIEQTHGLYNSESLRQTYMSALAGNGLSGSGGYPMNLRKIALLNGSGAGVMDHYAAACYVARYATLSVTGLEVFRWMNWFMPAYGVGAKPNTDLRFLTTPNTVLGRLTGFWWFVLHIISRSGDITNINPHSSMDVVPGASYNSIGFTDSKFAAALAKYPFANHHPTLDSTHTFIPTISGLGFRNPDFDWATRIDDRNLVCTNEIPFDNYFVPPTNEPHITLTADNVVWLKQEVFRGASHTSCAPVCLTTPVSLCEGVATSLTVSNTVGAAITWENIKEPVHNTSNITINSASNTAINVTANTAYWQNTNNVLIAHVSNPCGGDYAIRKKFIIIDTMLFQNPTVTTNTTPNTNRYGVTVTIPTPPAGVSYDWYIRIGLRTGSGTGTTTNSSLSQTIYVGDPISYTVTYHSACGDSYRNVDFILTSGGGYQIDTGAHRIIRPNAVEDMVQVSPNPAHTSWSFSFDNVKHQPKSIALSDVAGKTIRTVIADNPDFVEINCADFPKGIYMATIRYDDGTKTSLKLQKD